MLFFFFSYTTSLIFEGFLSFFLSFFLFDFLPVRRRSIIHVHTRCACVCIDYKSTTHGCIPRLPLWSNLRRFFGVFIFFFTCGSIE